MDVLLHVDLQICRRKVVLDCWIALNDVASAATHVDVPNISRRRYSCWPLSDVKNVRAVLECAASLVCIDSKAELWLLVKDGHVASIDKGRRPEIVF